MLRRNTIWYLDGKKKRHDPYLKIIPSRIFNYVTQLVSGIGLHDFNCGIKAYDKKVIKNLKIYGEMHRYIPVIAKWLGFKKIGEKVVQHYPRKYGITKFGASRFITGFLDLLSITFVYKFKRSPMHFFGTLGFSCIVLGSLLAFWLISEKLYYIHILKSSIEREIIEQPLFFMSLISIVIGIQLFLSGFLGEMIAYNHNKHTDYLIKEALLPSDEKVIS